MSGRGKIDGDRVAGMRSARNSLRRQKFRNRKSAEPQQMPRSPRAIVIANNFDSHKDRNEGAQPSSKAR